MKHKEIKKTNVARLLDKAKVEYELIEYEVDPDNLGATHIADELGEDISQVFKTIVLHGDKTGCFVCVLQGDGEIDLKKAAKISGNKKCATLPLKELLPTTGYVRGGCSPIGMKKFFRTVFHVPSGNAQSAGKKTAYDYETIFFSAGKVGYQVEMPLEELNKVIRFETADIIVEND